MRQSSFTDPSDAGAVAEGASRASAASASCGRPVPPAPPAAGAQPTPMMSQYLRAKKAEPEALLFFRMGDFYEMFGEDAVVASRELGIALTSRDKGENAQPMAGVPARAVDGYLIRLVRKGFKVAICEQMEDPRQAKGLVDRAIVRVVTAGTITEEDALDARANNFLASVHVAGERAGIAWVDVSTGRFLATELALDQVESELARIAPAEILCSRSLAERAPRLAAALAREGAPCRSERDEWRFGLDATRRALLRHFKVATVEGFGLDGSSPIVQAAGALVEYLEETQRSACEHVRAIEKVETSRFLVLDRATRHSLELVQTARDGRREGSLLDAIDATLTPMGGRLLREWLLAPLREVEGILHRQRGVAELAGAPFLREEVRELLGSVLDVERLAAKVSTGRANARDLAALAQSLAVVPPLRDKLAPSFSSILGELHRALDPLDELTARIRATLVDSPPLALKDGGIVRPAFSRELDELRDISGHGKEWMARFQADESARTGMPNLKVGFNSVFGYYIEVPRGQVDRVPATYIRRQTVKNAERYVTPELKEFESKVLGAEERARDLEYELFIALRDEVARHVGRILDTARAIATVDVLAALAQRAVENRYVAPEVDDGEEIEIADGRHPVIERMPGAEAFVPNDARLDRGAQRITILTGPNMAGKSTYIRQNALIVLLAQIGSFVPAREARIGVVDRIFTRVGAADDISRNASTFMVEMVEVANILNNASERSLVVLDEVGRGTSTFDGLALAWAIVEHLHERVGCRTLFATHYHQLTELASRLPGVCNRSVAVREWQDEILFLHKIVDGGTDRSYGIHVARLAGVPRELIERARSILRDLEEDNDELASRISSHSDAARPDAVQLALYHSRHAALADELKSLDLDRMTPIEALVALQRLRASIG